MWRRRGTAEDHPRVPADVPTQPGAVLPATAGVLTCSRQLQQGIENKYVKIPLL